MPNGLAGKVAIVTGAGRGLGRSHALLLAREGAKVVVNDLGGNTDGTGADAAPAQQVADEIKALGGEAVASHDDIADFAGAQRLVSQAVDTFGDLDILVNNAGILRDRMLPKMSEEEWDAVTRVHLKGTFCTSRWAAAYWRDQSKAGSSRKRALINTTSVSGLFGNVSQTNYGAAKTGIATFSIIADQELRPYGVRVNAVAPAAETRLIGGPGGRGSRPEAGNGWNPMDPANVSPFIAYLATDDCPIHGRVFFAMGDEVSLFQPFVVVDTIKRGGAAWTIEELAEQAPRFAERQFDYGHPYGNMLFRGLSEARG